MLWNLEHRPALVHFCKPFFVFMAWHTSRLLRDNLQANARRLLKPEATDRERRAHSKLVLANFYDFIVDIGRSRKMSIEQLLEQITSVEGREKYLATRARHNGAILVTAHLGSFETGVAALTREEKEIHVVFRRDEMPRFERLRAEQRRKLGLVEAPVDDGLAVWVRLRDALQGNAVVLMQGDRVLPGQRGIRMPFMDGHIMIPSGPIKLAIASGAPIIPVFAPRDKYGRVKIILEDPIELSRDVDSLDQHPALLELTRVIERYIAQYPDQWLAVHRAWCEDAPNVS